MGAALLSFIVGYVAGAKTGPQAMAELGVIWEAIRQSDEFQVLMARATEMLGGALAQGDDDLSAQLRELASGNEQLQEALELARNGDFAATLDRISQSAELQRLLSSGIALLGGALGQRRPNQGDNLAS